MPSWGIDTQPGTGATSRSGCGSSSCSRSWRGRGARCRAPDRRWGRAFPSPGRRRRCRRRPRPGCPSPSRATAGLGSYAQPPANTPASPSWFGPPSPGTAPPAPVPPPVRAPSAKRARRRDSLASLLDEQAGCFPPSLSRPVFPSPSPAGAFSQTPTISEVSGYDPGAAYGGLTGDRQGPAERTGMAVYQGGRGGTVGHHFPTAARRGATRRGSWLGFSAGWASA